jgi:hypothetical protein
MLRSLRARVSAQDLLNSTAAYAECVFQFFDRRSGRLELPAVLVPLLKELFMRSLQRQCLPLLVLGRLHHRHRPART